MPKPTSQGNPLLEKISQAELEVMAIFLFLISLIFCVCHTTPTPNGSVCSLLSGYIEVTKAKKVTLLSHGWGTLTINEYLNL